MIEQVNIKTAVNGCWAWCDVFKPKLDTGDLEETLYLKCGRLEQCERLVLEASKASDPEN